MRAILYLVFLIFHLISGGSQAFASTAKYTTEHTSSNQHIKKVRLKAIHNVQDYGSSEIADLGMEEDYIHVDDAAQDLQKNLISLKDYLLSDRWMIFSTLYFDNLQQEFLRIALPTSGETNPIYILQRVLRI